jgi:adenosylcobinamide kinase/adenosylcobinamide-phosphate guanylyltransferase
VDTIRGARFDVVLLELTFGATGPSTPGHLNHRSFAATLATLREVDASTDTTAIVAVHLGHHNPPTPALGAFLESVGARCVPDGYTWEVSPGEPMPQPRRRTLILGGARSGKSRYAERLAAAAQDVTYVATGWPRGSSVGDDWDDRVNSHQARRPSNWRTIETVDIVAVLAGARPGQTVLVDCLALWVTRLVDAADAWGDRGRATDRVTAETAALCDALVTSRAGRIIIVSNEVGSGVAPATASGGLFRDLLGIVNTTVANRCADVLLMIAGRPFALPAVDDDLVQPDRAPTHLDNAHPTPEEPAR